MPRGEFPSILPKVEELLGPAQPIEEVVAELDERYRSEGEYPELYFHPLDQPTRGCVERPLPNQLDQVGNLLGIKLSLNEFVSYGTLGTYINSGQLSERAIIISTYALCGFANFSSIGIQIGGIAALAPERKKDLAKVGLKAMFGGALASWLTATIAGLLL